MKWTFRKSIFTGFLAGLILLVALSYFTYKNSKNFYNSRLWISHTEEVILSTKKIHRLSVEISNAARGFVITNNNIFIDSLPSFEEAVQKKLFNLQQLNVDNPGQQIRIAVLDSLIKRIPRSSASGWGGGKS